MSIKLQIIVDDKGNVKVDQLGKKVKKTGQVIDKESKKMQKSWTNAAGAIQKNIVGLAGIGVAALALRGGIRTILAFEDAMAEVSTIVDTNVTDMKHLSEEILHLSTVVPQSAEELGAGLYETISAGITDTAEAMEFLEVASKLAVAGLSDTATTVDALTTIMNSYGLEASEATRVSDLLFKTVEAGKTKLPLLAGSIGNVASSAALAGIEIPELTAAIAIMTKATGQTDETMTSLNRLFLSITNSTPVVQKAARKLGIEWSASALRAKGFARFMEELTVAISKDKNAIFDLGLDMRAFKGLAILGGKSAEEFAKQIDEMKTSAEGATEKGFEKMSETVTNLWKILKNQFSVIIIQLGDKLLPSLIEVLKTFSGILRGEATEAVKTFTKEAGFKEWIAGAVLALDVGNKWAGSVIASMKGVQEEAKKTSEEMKKIIPPSDIIPSGTPVGDDGIGILDIRIEKEQILTAERAKSAMLSMDLVGSSRELARIAEERKDSHALLVNSKLQEAAVTDRVISQTQSQLAFQLALVSAVDAVREGMLNMSQSLARAIIHGEKLSKVFERLLKQMATRGLGALFGAGIGFVTSGFNPLGAIAGAKVGAGLGGQHGLDMTVPPGFPGDSFPVFATSGERVKITPIGGQRGGTNGGVNVNLALTVNAPMSKAEATGIAQRGLDIIASDFKKAVGTRKIRRSDIEKAV